MGREKGVSLRDGGRHVAPEYKRIRCLAKEAGRQSQKLVVEAQRRKPRAASGQSWGTSTRAHSAAFLVQKSDQRCLAVHRNSHPECSSLQPGKCCSSLSSFSSLLSILGSATSLAALSSTVCLSLHPFTQPSIPAPISPKYHLIYSLPSISFFSLEFYS